MVKELKNILPLLGFLVSKVKWPLWFGLASTFQHPKAGSLIHEQCTTGLTAQKTSAGDIRKLQVRTYPVVVVVLLNLLSLIKVSYVKSDLICWETEDQST